MVCQYCGSVRINANSLRGHELRCSNNPNKLICKVEWTQERRSKVSSSLKGRKCRKTDISEQERKRLSNSNKQRDWSIEKKEQHSIKMKNGLLS